MGFTVQVPKSARIKDLRVSHPGSRGGQDPKGSPRVVPYLFYHSPLGSRDMLTRYGQKRYMRPSFIGSSCDRVTFRIRLDTTYLFPSTQLGWIT